MHYRLEQPIKGSIGTLKYQCTIEWRNGKFITDEPTRTGGGDAGPDPFTLFLSSVATCTLVTLRMYIDHKGWEIADIGINVNLFQTKKDDKILTVIDRDVKFIQPVTDEQRTRLGEIAQSCPISKMLEGEIMFRTFVYNDSSVDKHNEYTNGQITVVRKPDPSH
ncbi:MAG TPA: OsmC family protein [Puia sp.]|nr:OsmC family protein [Puia sp.]